MRLYFALSVLAAPLAAVPAQSLGLEGPLSPTAAAVPLSASPSVTPAVLEAVSGYDLLSAPFLPYRRHRLEGGLALDSNAFVDRTRSIWTHRRNTRVQGNAFLLADLDSTFDRVEAEGESRGSMQGAFEAWFKEETWDDRLANPSGETRTAQTRSEQRLRLSLDPSFERLWRARGFFLGLQGELPHAGRLSRTYLTNDVTFRGADGSRTELSETQPESVTIDLELRLEGWLRAGYGRLDEMEGAWLAVRLLQSLARAGRLARPASAEEAQALALELLEIRRAYPWDPREQRLGEARRVLKALEGLGLAQSSDPETVLLVSDLHDYLSPSRLRGWQLQYLVGYRQDLSDNWFKSSEYDTTFSTGFNNNTVYSGHDLELRWEQPSSLNWQRSASLGFWWHAPQSYDNGISAERDQGRVQGRLKLGLGWYPGTRTSLSLVHEDSLSVRDLQYDCGSCSPSYYSYTERHWESAIRLTLAYQAAFNTRVSLNGQLHWVRDSYINEVYGPSSGGGYLEAFDADSVGEPVKESLGFPVSLRVDYRFR